MYLQIIFCIFVLINSKNIFVMDKKKLYGITRHGKHELMTNSIAVPTEFYHYYNGELIYTANNIGDVIKSIEKHSGDKINEVLKIQLMFNF